jgi:glycosyltransferase involved in cell wall biosynthesis
MQTDRQKSQIEARAELHLPADATVIGMVARLERWKGAHVFVEAAQRLLERQLNVTCFIVGGAHSSDLQYADEVKGMVRRLSCGNRFILAGQRSMEETLLWQAAADIIVQPVTGIEPFGMAIVEAMAQGKVVVTSNKGGPTEIIENGVNGILIQSGDAEVLASSLAKLVDNPEQRSGIEKAALIRGQSFSIPAFVSRLEALVQELLPSSEVG